MTRSAPDWFDYQAEKAAPKPAYQRPMLAQYRTDPVTQPIQVEESFMDTIRMKAFKVFRS